MYRSGKQCGIHTSGGARSACAARVLTPPASFNHRVVRSTGAVTRPWGGGGSRAILSHPVHGLHRVECARWADGTPRLLEGMTTMKHLVIVQHAQYVV